MSLILIKDPGCFSVKLISGIYQEEMLGKDILNGEMMCLKTLCVSRIPQKSMQGERGRRKIVYQV